MTQIDKMITKHRSSRLFRGGFGLEKENIRVTKAGELAMTPHPKAFGGKLSHPYITTDFSESQLEMITPVRSSVDEAVGFLETLHDEISLAIGNERLWPQSTPPVLPSEEEIPIATYGEDGKESEDYREYLAKQYGKKKQMISGVHVNISFDESILKRMYDRDEASDMGYAQFREALYLKTLRNFKRYRWFLIALLGNSPVVHSTFSDDCVPFLKQLSPDAYQIDGAISMRNSYCGYRNKESIFIDYSSYEAYEESLENAIKQKKIEFAKENYATIRLKSSKKGERITHLEVRLLDLDPFQKSGINPDHIKIIHQFLLFSLLTEEQGEFDAKAQELARFNHERIASNSLVSPVDIEFPNGNTLPLQEAMVKVFEMMKQELAEILPNEYMASWERLELLVMNPCKRPAQQMLKALQNKSYIAWSMDQAEEHLKQTKKTTYQFYGLEDMELSTQLLLREAMMRGIEMEVMDRQENFVRLTQGNRTEYVMQATRTSLDNYSSVLLMENKTMTKKVLASAGISTPNGREYDKEKLAVDDFDLFQGKAIVIKPKSTNYGLGITILKENLQFDAYQRAIQIAFEQDNAILIEEFVSGKEYRIFVIDNEVVGILHRVPANVVGNGSSTIAQLVEAKNEDPLRGKGYRTPLEKIAMGEAEQMFLESQGLDFDFIPKEGQQVFLRENSNISTGGDSLDFTDEVHESYKKIALEATKAMRVKVTGLDMMIDDIRVEAKQDNHSIIEMNFNPAIHIHCHPYKGRNRQLNKKMLDALEF